MIRLLSKLSVCLTQSDAAKTGKLPPCLGNTLLLIQTMHQPELN